MKFVGTKWECADDLDSVLASISTETIISPLGTWEAKTLPDPILYLEVYLKLFRIKEEGIPKVLWTND